MQHAYETAWNEAQRAFGDPTLYLEKYLENPRHIEFQVLADSFGNTIHLLERECSVQRRHQKIIEETPSPALSTTLRERMGDAAVAAKVTPTDAIRQHLEADQAKLDALVQKFGQNDPAVVEAAACSRDAARFPRR